MKRNSKLSEELFKSAEAIDRAYGHAEQLEISLSFYCGDSSDERAVKKAATRLSEALANLSTELRTVGDLHQSTADDKSGHKADTGEYYRHGSRRAV